MRDGVGVFVDVIVGEKPFFSGVEALDDDFDTKLATPTISNGCRNDEEQLIVELVVDDNADVDVEHVADVNADFSFDVCVDVIVDVGGDVKVELVFDVCVDVNIDGIVEHVVDVGVDVLDLDSAEKLRR
jgi:hypothetical protein